MSLVEKVAAKTAPMLKGQNIVTLDIERFKGKCELEFWSLGDFKNRRIPADAVIEWPRTICVAWREYGRKPVEFVAEWQEGGREAMLLAAWEAYDKADILVGHNLAAFDTKHLNSEWRDLGLPPPSPFKTIDTLREARKHFGDESKQLASMTKRLGIPTKTQVRRRGRTPGTRRQRHDAAQTRRLQPRRHRRDRGSVRPSPWMAAEPPARQVRQRSRRAELQSVQRSQPRPQWNQAGPADYLSAVPLLRLWCQRSGHTALTGCDHSGCGMNLLYRAYIDSGFPILICKITRRHHWVNASYREEACRRCPNTFRPRKDWVR